jgi:hypothetical protein
MAIFQANIQPSHKKVIATFSERSIFPIVNADQLLRTPNHKKIIGELKKLSGAPENYYRIYYQAAIENFVEFAQLLPTSNEARLGSLLDEGLIRSLFALQLYRQEQKTEVETRETARLAYVLFSASLMFDIGFVVENRTIIISDQKGNFIRQWSPYQGPMRHDQGYYKIRLGGGIQPWISRRLAPIFAKDTLPKAGYDWITEDSYALNLWLALLYNDQQGFGELGFYFSRANAMLEEFHNQQEYLLMISDIEGIEPKETKLGEDFIEWLKEQLRQEKLSVNKKDSKIHIFEKGMLLETPKTFEKFLKEKKTAEKEIDWKELLEQLKKMGFTDGSIGRYRTRTKKEGDSDDDTSDNEKNSALFNEEERKKKLLTDLERAQLGALGRPETRLAAGIREGIMTTGLWAGMLLGSANPQSILADFGIGRNTGAEMHAENERPVTTKENLLSSQDLDAPFKQNAEAIKVSGSLIGNINILPVANQSFSGTNSVVRSVNTPVQPVASSSVPHHNQSTHVATAASTMQQHANPPSQSSPTHPHQQESIPPKVEKQDRPPTTPAQQTSYTHSMRINNSSGSSAKPVGHGIKIASREELYPKLATNNEPPVKDDHHSR